MDIRPHIKLGCLVAVLMFFVFLIIPGFVGPFFVIVMIGSFVFGLLGGMNNQDKEE